MENHVHPWKSLEIHENLLKSMNNYEHLYKSMKIDEIHEHAWDIFISKKEDGFYSMF